jgi:hypothetical protein
MLRRKPPPPSDGLPHAPATLRNRDPILTVLREWLPTRGTVLELASGTGEHAAYFASALPRIVWQPSDVDPRSLAAVDFWRLAGDRPPPNLRPGIRLDLTSPQWAAEAGRAVAFPMAIVAINLLHIAPWKVTESLFAGAEELLVPRRFLYLYGPFKRSGEHTAPSNAAFDEELRARDPEWGVRDLETIIDLAARHRFELADLVDMPANNFSAVFVRL